VYNEIVGVDNMTYLSSKLKELREKNNVSQYKLSEDLDIKRSAYGNYETGMSYPEYEVLEKIAKYFSVDVNELLGYDKEFDKNIDLLAESEEIKKQIKSYFYKRYRKIPSDKMIKEIVSNYINH
jgi:transcriptional regulator with XRE-family HTH domain